MYAICLTLGLFFSWNSPNLIIYSAIYKQFKPTPRYWVFCISLLLGKFYIKSIYLTISFERD